jgi:hypothetical protein
VTRQPGGCKDEIARIEMQGYSIDTIQLFILRLAAPLHGDFIPGVDARVEMRVAVQRPTNRLDRLTPAK